MRNMVLMVIGVLFIICGTITTSSLASETLLFSSGEYPPWLGESLPGNGFGCDVVREAFKRENIDVAFQFSPWARAEKELKVGMVHGSVYWYQSAERKRINYISDPITREDIVFFYLKSRPMKPWQKLEDLKNYTIGVTRGYTYTDEFWELSRQKILKFEINNNDVSNFRKLLSKRIDILPISPVTGYEILHKNFAASVVNTLDYNSTPLVTTTGHVLFPKVRADAKKNVEIFNRGLAKIKEDGTYDRMYESLMKGYYSKDISLAQSTMNIVYFDSYPPFSWVENNKMKGILIDILTEALQHRMGIHLSHKGYPWARAQMLVKNGGADAFVSVPTPERKKYTKTSTEPAILITVSLFTKKDSHGFEELKKVKKISDLKRFKVVNYMGNGWAKQKLKGMEVWWVPQIESAMNLLVAKRADVYVDNTQVTLYNIKKLGFQDKIVEVPNIIDSTSFNLCIGKKSTYVNVLSEFDETIIKMKKDGTLQKICDKYK